VSLPERKPVEGFEEYYEVSSDGKVYSINQNAQFNKTNPTGELTISIKNDHPVVHFSRGLPRGGKKSTRLCVLMLCAFKRKPRSGEVPHYKDGNHHNCHIDNLEWTHQVRRKGYKLTKAQKYKNTQELKILKKKDIERIHELYSDGWSKEDIAFEFIIHPDCIRYILDGINRSSHNSDDDYFIDEE